VTFLDIQQSKQVQIKNQIIKIEAVQEKEVDTSVKGKIVEKIVYERHKHIFPYKNWKIVSITSSLNFYSSIRRWTTPKIRFLTCDNN